MSNYQASASTSISKPISEFRYDVFISFRGVETRRNFIGHLYDALVQHGIKVCYDDIVLGMGQSINLLFDAIDNSAMFLIVFSSRYAESKWCLMEVDRIMDSGRLMIPIFLNVNPSDVRRQSGPFTKAFVDHAVKEATGTINRWREALNKAATFSGYWLSRFDGKQNKLIDEVVATIHEKALIFEAAEHPVGLDDHLCKMTGLLQMEVDHHHEEEVRFVGIWGIGGLGKTTIAKSTFDKFYLNFRCSVFLRNVSQIAAAQERSSGLVELQRRFLYGLFNDKYPDDFHDESDGIRLIRERTCGKKILVILDDVDHMNQLHCLVKDGSSWLGKGSRIIITTRDRGILSEQGLSDDAIYTPNKLNQDQAFELFCYFAFKRRVEPTEEHDVQLAKDIIKSIGTLPLVLKVLGSDFSSIDMEHWRVRLESLKEVPHVDVQKTLQLSYDNLEYEQQQIFLDIACFFLGKYDENAMYMWEACNFQPKHSIEVLEQKLLVERNNNGWYHMHDEIRDMAREIIRQENQSKRWARSRVWTAKDALKAMMVKHCEEDSRNIKALLFNPNLQGAFTMGAMSAMSNMRMLIGDDFCHSLDSHRLRYDFQVAETPEEVLEITENIEDHQVPEPMWLRWCHYPFETMPQHALSFDQLVVLELPYFQGASLSFDTSGAKGLKNLKVLDLHSAKKLVSTPDFTLMPNLEKLILKDCSNLKDISPSIGVLQSLVELDLGGCEELKVLPLEIRHCFALKRLNADCCKTLRSLPIGIGTRRCSVSILQ